MTETWKQVKYENVLPVYEVSNLGRVRKVGLESEFDVKCWNVKSVNGRQCVVVLDTSKGKYKSVPVETLVALTFMKWNGLDTLSHKDGNVENNSVDNIVMSFAVKRKQNHSKVPSSSCRSTRVVDESTGVVYKSLREAEARTGVSRSSITKMVKRGSGELRGHRFRYALQES